MTLAQALTLPVPLLLLLLLAALAILAAEAMMVWNLFLAPLVAQWRMWRGR